MRKVDLGKELYDAMSIPDGPQKATTSALLLLLNAVHLIEPELDQNQPLRSLRDGQLPNGLLLETLNGLSFHKKTLREVKSDGTIETQVQKPTVPPKARSTLNALVALLQTERCALATRTPSERDVLVTKYLHETRSLNYFGNISQTRSKWRKKFKCAGLFGNPEQMRAFVCALMLSMLGDAATAMIVSATDKRTIERFRASGARVHTRVRGQIPDKLVKGAIGSIFDFSWHSDQQVSSTLESLSGQSLSPLFAQDTGDLGRITADILPAGIVSGRSLPK